MSASATYTLSHRAALQQYAVLVVRPQLKHYHACATSEFTIMDHLGASPLTSGSYGCSEDTCMRAGGCSHHL